MPMPDAADIAAIWQLLGYDPETTAAVILTPDSVVAIATDYPEPLALPQGVSDGK